MSDWQQVESKLLAAVAYVASRRSLYLRFDSGEVYRYYTFSADQYQEFLSTPSRKAATSSAAFGIAFLIIDSLAPKGIPRSDQDGADRALTVDPLFPNQKLS
jgi:hypothetical protein